MKSVDDARVSLKTEWLYEASKRPIVEFSESEPDDDMCGPTVEKTDGESSHADST